MVAGERDYLKQELGMFIEQIESLEKEKATLSQELKEGRELDEFKSLEEEFRKEHEVKCVSVQTVQLDIRYVFGFVIGVYCV